MTRQDYLYYCGLRARLREAMLESAANPSASVTVSTGDGSKSVSYKNYDGLARALAAVEAKCESFERAYNGRGGFSVMPVVWG